MFNLGIAYILWVLSGFGWLGFHRFYLGKIPSGLLWMFSFGLFGVGSIYDFFTLPGQVRNANLEKAILNGTCRPNINVNVSPGDSSWRNVTDGHTKIITEKESIEQVILKIAKSSKGIITVSEVALMSNKSIEEARKTLETMVSKGHAELRVRQSGALVYAIPDLMDGDEPLVD